MLFLIINTLIYCSVFTLFICYNKKCKKEIDLVYEKIFKINQETIALIVAQSNNFYNDRKDN